MDILNQEELMALTRVEADPAVSLFMPTHRMGPETQQDPIRFGNLLRDLETQLLTLERRPNVEAFLARARALHADSEFWRFQQEGLAVYFTADEFHAYPLPYEVNERLVVGDRFFLQPVLPLFTGNGHFWVLALSQNHVRLFEATRNSISEVELGDSVPRSMDDVHGDLEQQESLQGRRVGGGASGGGLGGSGTFAIHGHGGGGEVERVRLAEYFNVLDKAILPFLRQGRDPLVIAGVEYLRPIYREVTNYARVLEKGPDGNPDHLRADEIHTQAWPFAEEIFGADVEETLERFGTLASHGRGSSNFEEIVAAAVTGRVDTLILQRELETWGTFAAESMSARRLGDGSAPALDSPEADHAIELGGFAAGQTLLNGGAVYVLEPEQMLGGAEALAIYRY